MCATRSKHLLNPTRRTSRGHLRMAAASLEIVLVPWSTMSSQYQKLFER